MKLKQICRLFQLYDRVLFDNEISKAEINLELSMFNKNKYMGLFIGFDVQGYKHGHIKLSRVYAKKIKMVESTLIHEMVHCLQYIRGYKVNHGKFFKAECKRIKKQIGIKID